MSSPRAFPHDPSVAGQTEDAGVLTVNDVVQQDTYSVITRADASQAASVVDASYSYNISTGSMLEASRVETGIDADNQASYKLSLLDSSGSEHQVQQVLSAQSDAVAITARPLQDGGSNTPSTTATFDSKGLRWDSEEAALYLGQNAFRLKFKAPSSTAAASVVIEARNEDGDYDTIFAASS